MFLCFNKVLLKKVKESYLDTILIILKIILWKKFKGMTRGLVQIGSNHLPPLGPKHPYKQ